MRGKKWSLSDKSAIIAAFNGGAKVKDIAIQHGVSKAAIHQLIYRARGRGSVAKSPKTIQAEADVDVIEQRRREIPDDNRDLTARMFGDPLPGRSALDQVKGQKQ